jgi:mono/diheme cytochrome c family protein
MKILQTLVVAAALVSSMHAQGRAGATADGNAENGKKIFVADGCYQCHGYVGQGGRAGARIGPPVLNLAGVIRYVRRPTGQMPAYTDKVLTDAQLTDIYAYLKSLPAGASKDIPLLNDLRR